MVQTLQLEGHPLTLSFQLTEQQEQALIALWHFLTAPLAYNLFLLTGYAGTGKSTIVFQLVKLLKEQGKRIVMTAPTNKAVDVLRRVAAESGIQGIDLMTTHALLGLSMVSRGGEKFLEQMGMSYIGMYDVVFIDECSMIGATLWEFIERVANGNSNLLFSRQCPKLVLMGDPAQLKPVNEGRSPSFKVSNRVQLTQVVRQGDTPLLDFITAIRKTVRGKTLFQPFAKFSADRSNGAFMVKRQTLLKYACKKLAKEFAANPDCFRILCWTNQQVDWYNRVIRAYLYGEDAGRFVVGERLITREPVVAPDGKTVILATSTEVKVCDFTEDDYAGYKAWRVSVATNDGTIRQIYVLHEHEQRRFDTEAKRLLKGAKGNPFLWRRYYKHLETFANVRPCFALTVHNSQGSTFNEVGIDGNDLSKRAVDGRLSSIRETNSLWYVAASRAREKILVVCSKRSRRER
jgi:energy-coupling factor transporter ATP-binding protein EcfA2